MGQGQGSCCAVLQPPLDGTEERLLGWLALDLTALSLGARVLPAEGAMLRVEWAPGH